MTTSAATTGARRRPWKVVFTEDVLAAIPEWVGLGADRREIAEILGTTVGSLQATCSVEGISLDSGAGLTLERGLASSKWMRLRREALSRGVSVPQLVVSLVEAVIDDDMFDAVLDDGD